MQAALVLRRSCRFALTPVHEREEMLAKVWERVADIILERGKKLEAAVEFYKNSEKVAFLILSILKVDLRRFLTSLCLQFLALPY